MEILQPFPRRFLKRYLKEATPWARDNIGWAALMFAAPPVAQYIRNPRPALDWPLIESTLVLYAVIWVYLHCLSVGVVNRTTDPRHGLTYTLSSDPAILKALDELLFSA